MNKILDLEKFRNYKNVKTVNDQYISVNPCDQYIGRSLINSGIWEIHIDNLLKSICKEDMIAIDIGANVGAHTILMSKLVGENGKVYAFEPCRNHSEILFYNLMNNNCFNTTIYPYGCGDKDENMYIEKRFFDTKKVENFGAITLQKESLDENDEKIEIRSIDSFNFPKIDVIKIDAEGMENKIINGMKDTIYKYKPKMIIEIHDEDVENMTKIIDSIDYSLNRIGYSWDFLALPKNKV